MTNFESISWKDIPVPEVPEDWIAVEPTRGCVVGCGVNHHTDNAHCCIRCGRDLRLQCSQSILPPLALEKFAPDNSPLSICPSCSIYLYQNGLTMEKELETVQEPPIQTTPVQEQEKAQELSPNPRTPDNPSLESLFHLVQDLRSELAATKQQLEEQRAARQKIVVAEPLVVQTWLASVLAGEGQQVVSRIRDTLGNSQIPRLPWDRAHPGDHDKRVLFDLIPLLMAAVEKIGEDHGALSSLMEAMHRIVVRLEAHRLKMTHTPDHAVTWETLLQGLPYSGFTEQKLSEIQQKLPKETALLAKRNAQLRQDTKRLPFTSYSPEFKRPKQFPTHHHK
eukprot:TRINITY_DN4667_c0_g1_i2.p1 TRINITY_DN4667_c0_g1~~TRINITY_DN4667_c0_g1_i2.p1  ORF type:complete len:336 (+),score=38.71 TRINITY_DN4667_c0_g1_i2:122-1129(+)